MHLSDGFVSPSILIAGGAVAAVGVTVGLRKMENDDVPKVAVLTSAFFVASLIHLPMPVGSVHLILPGLLGILLGWNATPAVFTGLLMQYLFFGHGGITTLGINTVIFSTPALLCHVLLARYTGISPRMAFSVGVIAGVLGVLVSCLLFCGSLYLSGKEFLTIAYFCIAGHIPVAIAEGLITGSAVAFLYRVRPQSLPCRPVVIAPPVLEQ